MANPNIFQQYLTPPKSVADYSAEMDMADLRRLQMMGAQQQTQLGAMTLQEKQRAIQEAQQDQNALQRVASMAKTPDDLIAGLRASGRASLMKMADDREKALLDRKKTESDIGKTDADAARIKFEGVTKKFELFKGAVPFLESPQAIARWAAAQYQDPDTGPVMAQLHGPIEAFLESAPKSPDKLREWQQITTMGMEKYLQEQRMRAAQQETERNNKEQNRLTARGQDITVRGQNLTDARMRETNQVARDAAAAAKKEADINKGVTKYSDTLQKEGVPELDEAITVAENALKRYKPGEAPGVGRAAGMVPSAFLSDEGNDVRQSIAAVRNIVLNARSGAAVTDQELRRMVEELGTGPLQSEDALRRGLKKVRDRIEKIKANAAAGVSDEVKSVYEERGGVKINRGGGGGVLKFDAQGNPIK